MDEEDDYWNTNDTKGYNFDDDVLTPREILAIGRPSSSSVLVENDNLLSPSTIKSPLLSISNLMSSKVLEIVLQAQSGKDPSSKETNATEMDDVSITLKRLVLGRSHNLYQHRSMKSKTELLDGALAIGDGNAIMSVVLFLIQTLNKKLVYELLSSRPLALNHYISYLSNESKITELTDLLTMLGRSPEAAIYQFQHHIKTQSNNIDVLLRKLNNVLSNHFDQPGIDTNQVKIVNNYIKLLEWQKCANKPELYNKSAIHCLAHCCTYNWNEGAGKMMSPLTLCQQQQILPIQYDWTVLNVHSKLKNWTIVQSIFTKKDWLGRSVKCSQIPLPLLISRLNELEASKQILAGFINNISNMEERLIIAKQYKVHSVVIEILAKQKDRSALNNYKMVLNPQSEDYILCENTLRDPSLKWKN